MKHFLVIGIVVLCTSVCFGQPDISQEGFRADLTSTPAKFFFNGEKETGFNSPFMIGLAYDVSVGGGIWTPGLYFFTEIDTGDDDGAVKFGMALNLKTPFFGLGFGVFYEGYKSGKGNGGVQPFGKDSAGFLISYDISK